MRGIFLNGREAVPAGAEILESTNPGTGEVITTLTAATPGDVDDAVRDAKSAAHGWRGTKPAERGRALSELARLIRRDAEKLAALETADMGQTLTHSRFDVETAARYFEYYAGAADKHHGETIPLGPDFLSYTAHEPFGVVGVVVPWNAPINQAARSIAPALAVGNVCVAKPAEETSLTMLALAALAIEAGLPPGVLNVVTGYGRVAGEALVTHPDVRKVAFTGSVETGRLIMTRAAERLIPLTLELGGKSPNIIFADADLDAAAASAWIAFTMKNGQVCSAGTRLLVHADVHDEVVARLEAKVASARVGPGADDLDLGSMATRAQFEKVKGYLKLGVDEGAVPVAGGGVATQGELERGYFIKPTVFTGVNMSMRIAREEIFGPVLSVIPFRTDAEAIEISNDTDYGLVAGVWTTDLSRAHRVAAELEVGQVFVNQYFAGGVETPFGGVKNSGFGREKGLEALKYYSQTKCVTTRI
jgi:aldehyde dehydrogenase (NAD+)